MSIDNNRRRRSRKRTKPTLCPVTRRIRFKERQDAGFAVRDAKFVRAFAAINGRESAYRITRSYRCEFCSGFHTAE